MRLGAPDHRGAQLGPRRHQRRLERRSSYSGELDVGRTPRLHPGGYFRPDDARRVQVLYGLQYEGQDDGREENVILPIGEKYVITDQDKTLLVVLIEDEKNNQVSVIKGEYVTILNIN